ncbi:DEAD/DEAH box helicase [Lusitaniella coriacea LEGE 07157]|uniref:DEAD/DEAH box helicase n=1 Tax=Lusitaniella coriacea LEGE 07157 TaxID=945747 RepID=A0A8J7B7D5_9CYAN|nr:DEAD/DEAH box helicase [Lusitaniella coriacea]MBE9115171.1 DEAD/DEAH box helicase [Lusitaniella coriacea LEGE 07157]
MSNPFKRLAPFLQDYIYNRGWTELRQVQIEACRVIFDTNAHLLLATGTASGKTEAAFLPILTTLHENPSTSISVLYISPIKALINDQFERLSDLLKQTHTEVWAWHGDVSQSRKRRLLKNPQGILQITPESLESLLINQYDELPNLFQDLRFIVIDELHAFMESERGGQILCQLSRLASFAQHPTRRIGLSATLGDYSLAKKWLQSGTQIPVISPNTEAKQRTVRLAVEHFFIPLESEEEALEPSPYHRYIFKNSKGKKCLIFTNNRSETESVIANLRHIAKTENLPDIYHVHHGSISATLREDAEAAMRKDSPAVTAATLTLELGIDIGQLERVIQINSPFSVASFLQRLGRTGRRGSPADMRFVCTEAELTSDDSFPKQIPWQLLQSIAIIQLYVEERWIEPIPSPSYPFSLLYHQTMSILAAQGELSPSTLAKEVLTLPIFSHISQADFKQVLQYLMSIDHLQKTEKGGLILGIVGEKITNSFRFYAVFADSVEYSVKGETGAIGSISILPAVGQQFALAGRTWEVLEIDVKRRSIFVKPIEGIAGISWRGRSRGKIHSKVLQKMRQVLQEETEYSYLLPGSKERLKQVRQFAKQQQLRHRNIISLDEGYCCIFPWLGTVEYDTLERLIHFCVREVMDIRKIQGVSPYYFFLRLGKTASVQELEQHLVSFCNKGLTNEDIIASMEAPRLQKYDEFIPNNLLRKAFATDCLDMEALKGLEWVS